MPTLKNRLKTAEKAASPKAQTFNVWWEDSRTGLFTCENVPGVELTDAELDARPVPPNTRRIQVVYVDAAEEVS